MSIVRYPAEQGLDISRLTEPLVFHFSNRAMPNRIFKAAMGEALGKWDPVDIPTSGIPSEELIELYRRWGEVENNFGMIITGNVQISLTLPHLQGDCIIDISHPFHGPRFEAWQKLAAAGKAKGSLMIAQLSYAGRQGLAAIAKKEVIAPSVVPFATDAMNDMFAKTREATPEDIDFLIRGFAHAAKYLEAAGFDGIELHSAHGYVLAQFLSSRTNKRTDGYGGSLRNRMRLLLEVSQEIKRQTSPSFILGVKLNSVEFQEGGFTAQEAAEVAQVLQDEIGMDFVELSGGTLEKIGHEWTKETTLKREAFFLKFAKLIVPQLGKDRRTKVFITGGLRTTGAMIEALDTVDAVGIARPAAQEPWIARDLLNGKISGTIHPIAPFDNDSVMSNGMAGAQMRQVAFGRMPFISSDEMAMEDFKKQRAVHDDLTKEDHEKKNTWFVHLSSDPAPYCSAGYIE